MRKFDTAGMREKMERRDGRERIAIVAGWLASPATLGALRSHAADCAGRARDAASERAFADVLASALTDGDVSRGDLELLARGDLAPAQSLSRGLVLRAARAHARGFPEAEALHASEAGGLACALCSRDLGRGMLPEAMEAAGPFMDAAWADALAFLGADAMDPRSPFAARSLALAAGGLLEQISRSSAHPPGGLRRPGGSQTVS